MPLFADPFFLAYRSGTKLLDPSNYRVEQLPQESVLLMDDGHCLRDHALSACKIRNVDKISPVSANSLLTLIEMVDADLGVTYLPEMARDSWLLKNTRVMTVPLKSAPRREIGLVWRKGSARGSEFREFGAFIRDQR
jgi:LysR family hydrogen peroxide-inducible transcriptional activator